AIRLQPGNGRAFLVRSRALAALGQNEAATHSLQEAERLGIRTTWRVPYPEPEPTALDKARTLLESGNAGVAREVLEVAILNGTETSESNSLLALTHFQLKDYYRAIVAATRSLRWNPQNAEAYQVRGLSYLQRGRLDEAIFDLNAAIALDETLADTLTTSLLEARRQGGLDPGIRARAIARIKRFDANEPEFQTTPGESEQWLLELFAKSSSSQQIDQLRRLLADTPESEIDSLDWLADFLMLSRGLPGVESLRTWLNEESKSDDASLAATRLWESIATRGAASRAGVNLFADLPEFAINHHYLALLQSCVGTGLCRIKASHIYQAIDSEDSRSLRLVMPHVHLLERQVPGLLQHCIAGNKQEQARIIISRYESGLNWRLLEFLGMVDNPTEKIIESETTP
ncbi:MAG: tetratricopeptide repeat protein, partial [Pirellulaceae bacterium]